MTILRNTARRISLAWTPGYTTAAIVALSLAVGFLPFVKMGLVVNGVFLGAIIALGAIGLTLVFGILNFANVAHGDYMTMGAYAALFPRGPRAPDGRDRWQRTGALHLRIPRAHRAAHSGRRDRAWGHPLGRDDLPPASEIVASTPSCCRWRPLGVAIALRGLVHILWSGETQRYPRETRQVFHLPMDVRVPPDAIFIAIVTIVLVTGVYLVLTRTKMGKAMRATADNPNLALVSGIDTQRVIWWTWALGAGLAATAGILLAVFQAQLLPIMGWKFLIPLFAAVILGGIGKPLRRAGGAPSSSG